MAKIATFYSYKGGTGRSMTLANIAWVLASCGLKVLVIDWDLEAPGLHRYFRPFLLDKDLTRLESQGVIDLVGDFAQRLAARSTPTGPSSADWFRPYADITKWTQRLLWPSGEDARTSLGGFIDFVPAGRQGPQYAKKVNSFDWAHFYEQYNLGGFMDALRASMNSYDWVLIDSRTGVSDTSGICTVQFPHILVVCFTLNYQSIDGASGVAASAKAARKVRPLRILPVPMRLDGNEEKLLKSMMAYARLVFTPLIDEQVDPDRYWKEIGVPYFSRYAYSEKLAPFEDQVNVSTSTLPAVERLTQYLTDGRITHLEPLPEKQRTMVLAEFEQPPGEITVDAAMPQAAGKTPLSALARRGWYRYRWAPWVIGIAALILGVILMQGLSIVVPMPSRSVETASPDAIVATLVAAARKELESGRREHAALLIAEAASRLGPDAVVAPEGEPGKQVYDALQMLQPLTLASETSARVLSTFVFSPDGQYAASAAPRQPARLFQFPPQTLSPGYSIGYSTAAFTPDSRLVAAAGRDGTVNVVAVASSKRVWQWNNPDPESAWVNAIGFSPNGKFPAFGTDTGRVYLVQAETWAPLGEWDHGSEVLSLAFSPDSLYVATGGAKGDALFWSQKLPGRPVERLGPNRGPVRTIAFAPSSRPIRAVTAAGDGIVRLWTQTADIPSVANIPVGANVYTVAFSPDGTLLAIGDTDVVRLLHIENGKPIGSAETLSVRDVRSLVFGDNGTLLVTGDGVGTIQIWDVANRVELRRMRAPGTVLNLTLAPQGKYLGVGQPGGAAWTFVNSAGGPPTFPASEVRVLACSQVSSGSALSAEEWKNYFGANEPVRFTCRPETSAPVRTPSSR